MRALSVDGVIEACMDLILWRHAEAQSTREASDDLERALTAKGERQAQRMAEWLNRAAARRDARSSSARRVRAQQTAQALDRKFKTVAGAGARRDASTTCSTAARWPDAREPVLVVGHQPTLGLVAARLLAGVRAAVGDTQGRRVVAAPPRARRARRQVVLQAVQAPDC